MAMTPEQKKQNVRTALVLASVVVVFFIGILPGKKSQTCLVTALDILPPCTCILLILARFMSNNQGPKK